MQYGCQRTKIEPRAKGDTKWKFDPLYFSFFFKWIRQGRRKYKTNPSKIFHFILLIQDEKQAASCHIHLSWNQNYRFGAYPANGTRNKPLGWQETRKGAKRAQHFFKVYNRNQKVFPANQPASQPANPPASQPPASQPANQPANRPANPPTDQPASQPASQPARQHHGALCSFAWK